MENEKEFLSLAVAMENLINTVVRIENNEKFIKLIDTHKINETENYKKDDAQIWLENDKQTLSNNDYFREKLFASKDVKVYEDALSEFKQDWKRLLIVVKMLEIYNDNFTNNSFRIDFKKVHVFLEEYKTKLDGQGLSSSVEESRANQDDESEFKNVPLKKAVFDKLNDADIKEKVLEKLPKKEQKECRKWVLSQGKVYKKYFEKKYQKEKESILRYIKLFRADSKAKK